MRIAIVGVITKDITPHPLGGTEAFTYLLIKGLVELGHHVTLYSSSESKTSAQKLVPICDSKVAMKHESNVEFVYPYTLLQMRRVIEDTKKSLYDIIHVNILKTFFMTYFAHQLNIPILHTIHRDFFQNKAIVDIYEQIGLNENEDFAFVSKQAFNKSLIKKNTHVVYNGIDIELYPFSPTYTDTYIWLSRIDPLKGPKEAIEAVKEANVPLILSGDIDRNKYQVYYDTHIKPYLNESIRYEQAQGYRRKLELYQSAKAFIFPIQWEEPFGLVVVECLSTGTPVITFNRGAMSEIITDGETGFLVDPADGAPGIAKAIKKLESLSDSDYKAMRKKCHDSVQKKFSYSQTARNYEALYKDLISKYAKLKQ